MLTLPLIRSTTGRNINLLVVAVVQLFLLPSAKGVNSVDSSRLGTFYTPLPVYRSGAGTNIMNLGVGTPAQSVNLTLTTNVAYVLVATTDCGSCTSAEPEYSIEQSSSLTQSEQALDYTTIYPVAPQDTITFSAVFASDILTDARGDDNVPRPLALVNEIEQNVVGVGGPTAGTEATLSAGTDGFWGLGIDQTNKIRSIIPTMLQTDSSGSPSSATSYVIGFDINNFTTDTTVPAGTVHWGGVPTTAYSGDFNWLNANTTVAGSWGIGLDRIRVGSTVVDVSDLYGSLDPGYDAIYVPTKVAESLFAAVPGATRDLVDTTRWNLPCDTVISMSVTISSTEYNVDSTQLVQPRDRAGQTCWSSIVAWSNGSLAERDGEVRLGTPFMSGVYSAIYYSTTQQLVGIAGKPNSVNDLNVAKSSGGGVNGKLAGGLIGGLLGAVIIGFLLCYSHNRNSFQSIWYRAIRRQHRAQMNAVVRGATLPPPMMPMPMGIPPPMMGPPIGVHPMMTGNPMMGNQFGGMGYHPAMRFGFQPPPRYQPPMTRDFDQQQYGNQPVVEQQQRQPLLSSPHGYHLSPQQSVPVAIEPHRSGVYVPRNDISSRDRIPQQSSPQSSRGRFPNSNFFRQTRWRPSGDDDRQSQGPKSYPQSAGSKVRFGGVGAARQTDRTASSISTFNGNGQTYGAAGQAIQPHQGHSQSLPNPTTAMFYPGNQHPLDPPASATGSEKKRFDFWKGNRGEYQPVLQPGSQGLGGVESPASKRRSGLFGSSGRNENDRNMHETGQRGWRGFGGKAEERERERQRLAEAGGYAGSQVAPGRW